MHPKQTPSHLDSNKKRKKLYSFFFQGGRAGGSSVSIYKKKNIEKNKLVTTITLVAAVGYFVFLVVFRLFMLWVI